MGHLTDEAKNCVRNRGHVLIYHGGGCAPYTRVNDAHRRASAAGELIARENEWANDERAGLMAGGSRRIPDLKRGGRLSLMKVAWSALGHQRPGRKAHLQTGPAMPLAGSARHDDVFRDIRRVIEAIARDEGRDPGPGFVDMQIRKKAVAYVNAAWAAGRLSGWDQESIDALVEDHAPEESPEEGQGAFVFEAAEGDEDEGDGARDRR